MKLKLFTIFLLIFIFLFPIGTNAWWDSNWAYRRNITINNTVSALTDYQVLVTLDTQSLISAGKMRSDCGDIRFTDSDDTTLLNYWLESGCNSANTRIWVKVPSIPSSATSVCCSANEGSACTATCPVGKTVTQVKYVKYGALGCGNLGACDSPNGADCANMPSCIGQSSCTWTFNNANCRDTCLNYAKTGYLTVVCSTPTIKLIYLYYGNPSASSVSNGTNTFDYFTDFSGSSLPSGWSRRLAGKMTSSGYSVSSSILDVYGQSPTNDAIYSAYFSLPYNYSWRVLVRWSGSYQYGMNSNFVSNSHQGTIRSDWEANYGDRLFFTGYDSQDNITFFNVGGTKVSYTYDTMVNIELRKYGSKFYWFYEGNSGNATFNYTKIPNTIGFGVDGWTGASTAAIHSKADYIAVGKYTSSEPTIIISLEETPTTTTTSTTLPPEEGIPLESAEQEFILSEILILGDEGIYFSGNTSYIAIYVNASMPNDPYGEIGMNCYLEGDETTPDAQNCSVKFHPQIGVCSILWPNYFKGLNESYEMKCKIYNPKSGVGGYINRSFVPINFSVWFSDYSSLVGEEFNFPVNIKNSGLFSDTYNLTAKIVSGIASINPATRSFLVELHGDAFDPHIWNQTGPGLKQAYIKTVILDASSDVILCVNVTSTIYPIESKEHCAHLKAKFRSLPELGLLQIFFLAFIATIFIFKFKIK